MTVSAVKDIGVQTFLDRILHFMPKVSLFFVFVIAIYLLLSTYRDQNITLQNMFLIVMNVSLLLKLFVKVYLIYIR